MEKKKFTYKCNPIAKHQFLIYQLSMMQQEAEQAEKKLQDCYSVLESLEQQILDNNKELEELKKDDKSVQ